MIYHKKFLFIHLMKTSGTWMRRACELLPGTEYVYPHHRPLSDVPALTVKERQVFTIVRNPWDWYVSMYCHWHSNVSKRIHEFAVPYRCLGPKARDTFERYQGSFEKMVRRGAFAPSQYMRPSMSEHIRVMTERADNLDNKIQWLKFEASPLGNFRSMCSASGITLRPDIVQAVSKFGKVNSHEHAHYRDWYSDELQEIVAEREAWAIERFGYEF